MNRLQFVLTYVGGAFVGTLVGIVALSVYLEVSRASLEATFDHLQTFWPAFFVVGFVFWYGLLAGRAHDLGFSGLLPCLLFSAVWLPWFVVMDNAMHILGGALVRLDPSGVYYRNSLWILVVALALMWVMIIAFALIPGQKQENRFGPPPKLA